MHKAQGFAVHYRTISFMVSHSGVFRGNRLKENRLDFLTLFSTSLLPIPIIAAKLRVKLPSRR